MNCSTLWLSINRHYDQGWYYEMGRAIYITGWETRYEVSSDGRAFTADGKKKKRGSPLNFVRWRVFGLMKGEGYCELIDEANEWKNIGANACRAFGLFAKMTEIAAAKKMSLRGWILCGRNEAMNATILAKKLMFDPYEVAVDLYILEKVGWIEVLECPFCSNSVDLALTPDIVSAYVSGPKLLASDAKISDSRGPLNNRTERNGTELNITEQDNVAPAHADIHQLAAQQQISSSTDNDRGTVDTAGSVDAALDDTGYGNTAIRGTGNSRLDTDDTGDTDGTGGGGINRGAKGPVDRSIAADNFYANETPDSFFDRMFCGICVQDIRPDYDNPVIIMDNLPSSPEMMKQYIVADALTWFRWTLPSAFNPPETAAQRILELAKADNTSTANILRDAYDVGGGELVIDLVKLLQEKVRDKKKPRSKIKNVMAVWRAAANKILAGHQTTGPSEPP